MNVQSDDFDTEAQCEEIDWLQYDESEIVA